jgi:hypothetical protein
MQMACYRDMQGANLEDMVAYFWDAGIHLGDAVAHLWIPVTNFSDANVTFIRFGWLVYEMLGVHSGDALARLGEAVTHCF